MLALSFLLLWIDKNALSETHFNWNDGIRPYLKCPIDCLDLTDSVNFLDTDGCCRCNAQAQWDLDDRETEYISIENGTLEKQHSLLTRTFNDSKENNRKENSVLNKTSNYNLVNQANKNVRFQILTHTYSFLRETPKNLYSFSKLVKIDLTGNFIEEVPYIGNLSVLDTLILQYNLIKIVRKETFSELSYLRIIDLAHNAIQSFDPGTLSSPRPSLHKVSLDHNNLQSLDVSNIFLEKPFCALYYGENKITQLTNQLRATSLSKLTLKSGGLVDLKNNLFQSFFNFTELGLTDITLIGYMIHFWFDLRGPKWNCDCNFVPVLEMFRLWMNKFKQESFNIICNNPPNLRGLTIPDLLIGNRLDDFICRIFEGCPSACYCYHQPSQSRYVVNCSNSQIKRLPRKVPDFDNIHLLLRNNTIAEFDDVSYINRLTFADLSRNPLHSLSNDLLEAIRKGSLSVILTNISLQDIPTTFRDIDPCELNLGYQRIHCNCKNKWVQQWLLSNQADKCNRTKLYCLGEDELVTDFDMDSLSCREYSTELHVKISLVIAVITLTITCCCALLFYCRYEILLIQSKIVSRNQRNRFKYDAYISFYEYSDVISTWVQHVLVPFLEDNGYSLYLPSRDNDVGDVKEQSIINGISDSRNIIVVLSECHKHMDDKEPNTLWINLEWRHAWNQLISKGNSRNIVIINFDCLRWRDFRISPMRAFFRLGLSLDFSNKRKKLLSDVQDRLGNPEKSDFNTFCICDSVL